MLYWQIFVLHQYTFQLNPVIAYGFYFYSKKKKVQTSHYLKYQEAPRLLFIPSQVSGWQNSLIGLLVVLPTILTFPSPLSLRAHLFALSYCLCYFYVEVLSFWTLVLTWKVHCWGPPDTELGSNFQGRGEDFLLKNVWLVNMSPDWKVIPWKTGRMFFKPTAAVCAIHFSPSHTLTRTHTLAGKAGRSPAQQRYCLSGASSPGVVYPRSTGRPSIIRFSKDSLTVLFLYTSEGLAFPWVPSGWQQKAKRHWPLADKILPDKELLRQDSIDSERSSSHPSPGTDLLLILLIKLQQYVFTVSARPQIIKYTHSTNVHDCTQTMHSFETMLLKCTANCMDSSCTYGLLVHAKLQYWL